VILEKLRIAQGANMLCWSSCSGKVAMWEEGVSPAIPNLLTIITGGSELYFYAKKGWTLCNLKLPIMKIVNRRPEDGMDGF
jgi:hypothetical protein